MSNSTIISSRSNTLAASFGFMLPVSNPASQLLATLLDLPAPQGESASYVEAR